MRDISKIAIKQRLSKEYKDNLAIAFGLIGKRNFEANLCSNRDIAAFDSQELPSLHPCSVMMGPDLPFDPVFNGSGRML